MRTDFSKYFWCFVTDFSETVGYGHLRRCEILGKKLLASGARVCFLFRNPELTHDRFEYFHIPSSSDLLDLASEEKILIVDDHGLDGQYVAAFEKFCLVVGLDELGELRAFFDLHFVTTLLGVSPSEQRIGKCREWIGIKWFVFDDEDDTPSLGVPDKIPVTFGGSDPARITEKFLQYLETENLEISRFLVFLGPGFAQKRCDWLRNRYPEVDFRSGVSDLRAYFRGSAFVIASGGITAYEILKAGSIPLLIAQHQEQATVIEELSDKGLAINLGNGENFHKMCLKEHIFMQNHEPLRVEFQKRFSEYGAGQGADSILRQVLEHAKHRSVS